MMIIIGLGVLLGALMGLSGAGGGVIAIPLLMFSLHLSLTQASPIGLFATFVASLIGTIIGLKNREVRYKAALWIGTFGVLFAPFGVWLAHYLPTQPLMILFAIILMVIGASILQKKSQNQIEDKVPCVKKINGKLLWTRTCAQALAGVGSGVGVISGLLGIGGGFMVIPALSRYTNLDFKTIQVTTLAITAMIALSGTVSNVYHGNLMWQIALPFTVAAIVAMLIARYFANKIEAMYLRKFFGIVCIIIALLLIYKAV